MNTCPPKIKPVPQKDLVFFPPLHTRAQDGVGDFMASKLFREMPRMKPSWDCARKSPGMELIVAKRFLEKSKVQLAEKREYQKEKRTEMDDLWEALRKKEDTLRESFQMYDKFVKENSEKRERAIEKIAEEESKQEKRKAEINDINLKADELARIQEAMERHVGKLQIYQDFLDRVVKECPEFNSVYDILDRYETLKKTRTELAKRQDKDLQNLESARKELMTILEEKSKALMGYNNTLADLWIRYDKARMEDLQWESSIIRMHDKVQEKIREYGATRLLIWRMYKLICQVRLEQPSLSPGQIEEQLLFIQHNMLQFNSIAKEARRTTAGEPVLRPNVETHQSEAHSPRTIAITANPVS